MVADWTALDVALYEGEMIMELALETALSDKDTKTLHDYISKSAAIRAEAIQLLDAVEGNASVPLDLVLNLKDALENKKPAEAG